jgi:hypothetical protein
VTQRPRRRQTPPVRRGITGRHLCGLMFWIFPNRCR